MFWHCVRFQLFLGQCEIQIFWDSVSFRLFLGQCEFPLIIGDSVRSRFFGQCEIPLIFGTVWASAYYWGQCECPLIIGDSVSVSISWCLCDGMAVVPFGPGTRTFSLSTYCQGLQIERCTLLRIVSENSVTFVKDHAILNVQTFLIIKV